MEVVEVPVEAGGLETRMVAILEAAEKEQFLRFGEEDLGVLAQDLVEPGGAGALGANDEEVGKTVEREPVALDLAVAQAFADGSGNQGAVLLVVARDGLVMAARVWPGPATSASPAASRAAREAGIVNRGGRLSKSLPGPDFAADLELARRRASTDPCLAIS